MRIVLLFSALLGACLAQVVQVHADDLFIQPSVLPEYVDDRLPQCALHVFRHISKTGGTTIRFVFDRQTVMGEWEYPLTYGFKPHEWEGLLTRWKKAADNWHEKGGKGPRVLVEIRGVWPDNWPAETFFTDILPKMQELKEEYGPKGCELTTSYLMREPIGQYISFYNYYIKREQEKEVKPGERRSDPPGKLSWGHDMKEWAINVPDMQMREVMGTKCYKQFRQPGYDVQWVGDKLERKGQKIVPKQCLIRKQEWLTFTKMMRQVDVVGVTSMFNDFLFMLCDKVGMRHPQYIRSNEGKYKKGPPDPEIVELIKQVTEYDQQGHDFIKSLQEQQLANAGEDFTRRLELYKSATSEKGGKKYVGGFPVTAPYMWVDEKEANAQGVKRFVPDFFTEHTGGGQAIASSTSSR
eukprot:CAMPEP_0197851196 /NCGR_PEP_ID=MMETSP1438-20131217/17512_1 /TAXON_ID=1461541 /ORGANISM="Pterosperma sp., Strain CCMP1384" /LENGTH=408 /DNA_ID=CAMNT_0043464717 /DNA_START=46 /DNA_END=1273 /DNA_ORIENTATION=-